MDQDVSQSQPRAFGGRWVVVGIFVLAIVMATFAWWWNYHRGRQTLEFLGTEGAFLVRAAPSVELLRTDSDNGIDMSHAPGLINARASLLSDGSYEWDRPAAVQGDRQLAVRFADGDRSIVLTFDFKEQAVRVSSTNRVAALKPKTAAGWQQYLNRQLKSETKSL